MDQQYSNTAAQEPIDASVDPWRNEIQARLEGYKRRRGRRIEGAYSMRFPFPAEETATAASVLPPAEQLQEAAPVANELVAETNVAADELHGEPGSDDPLPLVAPDAAAQAADEVSAPPSEDEFNTPAMIAAPRPRPRRKVIAFPAPSYAIAERAGRLADPVEAEQLRILDVPEELQAIQATPFLDGLFDSAPNPAARAPGDNVELPCASQRVVVRFLAASADAAIVLAGIALFGAAAYRLMPNLAFTKSLIAGAAAVCVLLWAMYEYLFIVYGARTPGMVLAKVRIQTFKGRAANFRQRQLRVLGLYLSVLSLGMGVMWCFVDVDSLCWHDRISQTFPVREK